MTVPPSQNNDASWHGYYLSGQGCEKHKSIATEWLGSIASYLKFHLLEWGVMEESAMKLIRASCTTQALRDAINTTMKDGKVMLAAQAEMDNNIDEMLKRACWVDITKRMEMFKRVE